MLGKRRGMSHDSRRPRIMTARISGIGSPPPTGTSSPLTSWLMLALVSPGNDNESRCPIIGRRGRVGPIRGAAKQRAIIINLSPLPRKGNPAGLAQLFLDQPAGKGRSQDGPHLPAPGCQPGPAAHLAE